MDSPTRYALWDARTDCGTIMEYGIVETDEGQYVLYPDYALLKAKYEEATAEIWKLKRALVNLPQEVFCPECRRRFTGGIGDICPTPKCSNKGVLPANEFVAEALTSFRTDGK
jgi:hypothetical protein